MLTDVLRTRTYMLHVPRVVRQDGHTALMYAARDGHTDTVRPLLERGVNVNHADRVSAPCMWLMFAKANVNEHIE